MLIDNFKKTLPWIVSKEKNVFGLYLWKNLVEKRVDVILTEKKNVNSYDVICHARHSEKV